MTNNYHLSVDLGLNKQALKRSFEENYGEYSSDEIKERGLDLVKFLLNKPTQRYTANEVQLLVEAYWTAHDECVLDNEDDYSNIEVYHAQKKEALVDKVMKIISE